MKTMFKAVKGNCNYCGAIDVYICSTPEKDGLCAECHKLVIENSREAIKAIKTAGGKSSKNRTNKNTVLKAKADAEAALFKLTGGVNIKL